MRFRLFVSCGALSLGLLVGCAGDSPEDGTPTETDSGTPAGCGVDGTACNDGDPCTRGDLCIGGLCYGTVYSCDDSMACTKDACVGDGTCSHDLAAGYCGFDSQCLPDGTPNPDNPCQSCQPATDPTAWSDLEAAPCDDGDPCTEKDACSAGACQGEQRSCDDGLSCTHDACAAGEGCKHELQAQKCLIGGACYDSGQAPDESDSNYQCLVCNPSASISAWTAVGGPCGWGNPCTDHRYCQAGECVEVGVPYCSGAADTPCTKNTCDPGKAACAMQPSPDLTACDDGNGCTSGDVCMGGVCQGGSFTCECATIADCADFEDDDLCNGTLQCSAANTCEVDPQTVVTCDASGDTGCQVNLCNPKVGGCTMTTLADGTGCSDGDPCTLGDVCLAGDCVGSGKGCDDGNPCTIDDCGVDGECTHVPSTGPCDDYDACTSGDVCTDGECIGAEVDCDDDNPCTGDTCDSEVGCQNPPIVAPCDDGKLCTEYDSCHAGQCYGKTIGCNDGDPCTADECDEASGTCFHESIVDCVPPAQVAPFTLQDLNPYSPTKDQLIEVGGDYLGYVYVFTFHLFH